MSQEQKQPQLEGHKQLFDALKHLTTLSTSIVVVLAAFLDKLFTSPAWKPVAAASIVCLLATVFIGVTAMLFSAIGTMNIESTGSTHMAHRVLRWMGFGFYSFVLGLLLLVVFFLRNFL